MLSETGQSVVAAAQEFCKNCDHIIKSMQFQKPPGELFGRECGVLSAQGMVDRHRANNCAFAMVKGVSGVMTTERFMPEGDTNL